ncbi:hypothetical protein TVAG_380190 [Trichomonas vaginalis G3]|uniref:Exportin-1 C-terminal domain-containing protein n=1 Tax=Trichomonas vaginalis (strain ATCC PRA-98 / G3) TaxID=412133 RepID=A2DXF7_TRIV3|nr:nuclear export signal receptor protein [Trichomonas vaginalis G3]EAY14909.1 hypothetical protein TVAG_380190 [Trichomonas vaginalis G3]KAI5485423.1 nuclear export signal receptor protein [Trichomonas vaginalis G3]|eukprot:XP_001327132.1 hypothetical protein [Trichomonas vaginalis G3]
MLGNTSCLTEVGEVPDIAVLERVYKLFSEGKYSTDCDRILNLFKDREDMINYIQQLIESATYDKVIHLLYKTLRENIQKRWELFNDDERVGIQNYVFEKWVDVTNNRPPSEFIIVEIDNCAVAIILKTYPQFYPNVIKDILSIANPINLENIVRILQFLLDELYNENAENYIPYRRINEITTALEESAEDIFNIVQLVFSNMISRVGLMKNTLLLLRHFIKSIPPAVIVENNIFTTIIQQALPNPNLVSESLSFLAEVYGLDDLPDVLVNNAAAVFHILITTLAPNLSDVNFQEVYDADPFKVRSLSNCLITFFLKQSLQIEIPDLAQELNLSLEWIYNMSDIGDSFVQRICADFWKQIARRIWKEANNLSEASENLYLPIMQYIRRLYIKIITRPEDFILNTDPEESRSIRQETKNTEDIELFKCEKELLIFLTNIDNADMVAAINELLAQLEESFNEGLFNAFCYSVGAITGTLGKDPEKDFLLQVVQSVLGLNQKAEGNTEVKALISAGLCYILSQYPRFLASDLSMFKTLIAKLFEFMAIPNPAVKEMAVNSLALVQKTTGKYFNQKSGSDSPFIMEIMQSLNKIIENLENKPLIIRLFGILASIIGSHPRTAERVEMLLFLVSSLNENWNNLLQNWEPQNESYSEELLFLLECNSEIASNITNAYGSQLRIIFNQLMEVYSRYSNLLQQFIGEPGYSETKEANCFKRIKSKIVLIINDYILKTPDVESVANELIEPISQTIILEYENSHPLGRVPEVLSLVTSMSNKMKKVFGEVLPNIYGPIFNETLAMIKDDFSIFPEFRVPFFKFVDNIVTNYISIMLSAPDQTFSDFIETIKLGCYHTIPEVCIISLSATEHLFKSIKDTNMNRYRQFLSNFYMDILVQVIKVTTDTYHKFAFREEVNLIRKLLSTQTQQLNGETIASAIQDLFPNRDYDSLVNYMSSLIANSNNMVEFQHIFREFVISTTLFSRRDNDLDLNRQEETFQNLQGMNGPANPEDY